MVSQLWSRHNGQQELNFCQASKAPFSVGNVSLEEVKLSWEKTIVKVNSSRLVIPYSGYCYYLVVASAMEGR